MMVGVGFFINGLRLVNSVIDYMVLLIYQLLFLSLLAYNGHYNMQGKTSD
ncbi:hypothetical protein GCM10011386_48110 [Parapedobacter defluvii]|uniref:Uncharacterized protein n=1 Tax=Parapedobacter defluvii TaxID=2045106 RepID=A0ABQ1MZR1_9SPHI|nr:hypothetical protein GCM10011386_48110 [Parapedobacter defluvii]